MSKIPIGFDPNTIRVPLDNLLPSRKIAIGLLQSRKYQQILASIREVGVIEPISVIAADAAAGTYLLFPLIENGILLGAIAFLLGLGTGCGQPLTLMMIYARAPEGRSGEALGLRMTINNLTHIIVPLFFGAVGTAFGVAPVFIANAAMLGASGLLSRRR